jgi:ankyrin repeat protein
LGLEPPWSTRNSTSGLYRTDEHVIPLTIRLLDGLRLSKASGYADFAEDDYAYGCKSPFAYSHLAVNTGLKDKITNLKPKQVDLLYHQALLKQVDMKEYVDELTSRLFNLNVDIMHIPVEKQDDIKNSIHADVSKLMARTAGDTLATVDKNMTEKTTSLVDRLMVNYFSIWREGLTDEENVELQTTTRSKIEQVFKQFNQEKNAERRLNDCFDLAFCAKASESDQSAERLQAMVDRVNIFGVLRGASVNSAQWFLLLRIDGLESSQQVDEFDETEPIEAEDVTDLAKHAVRASSYGLLKATLDEMNARNMHVADDDWIDMTLDALERSEPSIIKQCLNIKGGDVASTFEGCTEEEQADLIYRAMDSDEMEYSMRSSEDRLQMLLDAGVDVNAKPKYRLGETALMRACRNGDEAIVSKFIEAGADVNVEDQFGHTALSAACFRRHEAVVTQLLDAKADVDVKDNRGETALMRACRDGGEAVVTQLIEARADVSAKDNRGGTALMAACRNGDEAIVLKLIEVRADVDVKDNLGVTALMCACSNGHGEIVTQLIEARVDVNARNKWGQTALMDACTYGDEAIVLKLIEKNADINATTDYGKTALMYACEEGYRNVVSQLLEAGADVYTKDSKGKTAYDYAVDKGYADLANRVIALESEGTRANRIARETGGVLGVPAVLTALAVITTAAMYASGSLDTALESASQAMPDILSAATNVTSQALTELTTAAIEIGRQMGYGPSL